jgi:undecaprenyl-phosphate 4-deoxy-4-formamido-L-arabinose transferase
MHGFQSYSTVVMNTSISSRLQPELSVIIPVFNETDNLEQLFQRLKTTLDALQRSYEILFTNDGSTDNSFTLLASFYRAHPQQVRVIDFNGNFGQHMAIMAAFERCRGEVIITLDADLQNPPEEIGKLLAKIDEGYDVVGGYRKERQDTWTRKAASRFINWFRERSTTIRMKDQGCMLRAYRRTVVQAIVRCKERATFIPALAYNFASRPTEVEVDHCPRASGTSKYSYYKLLRLNFDLITGFTLVPLQLYTLFGFFISLLNGVLVVSLLCRRWLYGPEAEGLFTLFAVLFFLISVAITGIGLVGEYVGRTYQAVQQRPRYIIRETLGIDQGTQEPREVF